MNTEILARVQDPLLPVFERLLVEILVLIIVIPVIYRRFLNNREHMFPFFLMGMMIFIVCVLLKNVEIQMGMVLGLFAIFSILRFRSFNFTAKDMSYLFAVIGLSAINAMLDFPNPIRGTAIFNGIVILTILALEIWFKKYQPEAGIDSKKKDKDQKKKKKPGADNVIIVIYDKPDLLQPSKRVDLLSDLSNRSGKEIYDIRIRKIDLISGQAEIEAYSRDEVTATH
jgi:hypothetical protein